MNAAVLLLAVDLPTDPTTLELLWFALTGMLVVMLSLSLLAMFSSVLARLIRLLAPRPLANRAAAPPPLGEVPDEEIAVIAAAVAAVIDARHRIISIRGLTPEDLSWSLEGRLQHHSSHKPARPRH
ncbi:MAG: OadG family transporter subunit [Pirellulales bacterium]